jgi:hypothetical protein
VSVFDWSEKFFKFQMFGILSRENDLEEKRALDNFQRFRVCNFGDRNLICVRGVS